MSFQVRRHAGEILHRQQWMTVTDPSAGHISVGMGLNGPYLTFDFPQGPTYIVPLSGIVDEVISFHSDASAVQSSPAPPVGG